MSGLGGLGQGGGAPQFTLDASQPAQFTMPGGAAANYQGVDMMPAVLGGVQGVSDAMDWTDAMQGAGGGITDILQAIAQGGGGGQLQMPQQGQAMMGGGGGGARAGGGQATDWTPSQLNLQQQAAGGMQGGQSIQNLLQLLQMGNRGFNIR